MDVFHRDVRHPGPGGPGDFLGPGERGLGADPPGLCGPAQEGHEASQTGRAQDGICSFSDR